MIIKQYHSLFTAIQGELINRTLTFGPNDTEKVITLKTTDDDIPLEPIEQYQLFLNGIDDGKYNILFEPYDNTTIYIMDNDGM